MKQDRRIGLLVEATVKMGLNRRNDEALMNTLKMAIKSLCRGLPYEWSKITNKGWTLPIPDSVLDTISNLSAQVRSAFDSIIDSGEFIPIFVRGTSAKIDPVDHIRVFADIQARKTAKMLEAAYRGGVWDGKTVNGVPELVGTSAHMLERGYVW